MTDETNDHQSAGLTEDSRPKTTKALDGQESETVWSLVEWVGTYTAVKKFLATRRVVMRGIFPGDLPDTERRGLMGPWQFNAYQSVVSAMLAKALSTPLEFLYGPRVVRDQPSSSDAAPQLLDAAAEIMPSIERWLDTLAVPFSLLIVATVVAQMSLRRGDSTTVRRRRARDYFLYLDGAYGVIPQIVLAMHEPLLPYLRMNETHSLPGALAILAVLGCGIAALVYQQALMRIGIPSELFNFNGYPACDPPRLFRRQRAEGGPWRRFRWGVLWVLPILLIVTFAEKVLAFLSALAAVLVRAVVAN